MANPESGSAADVGEVGNAHPHPRYYLIWLYLFLLTVAEVLVAFVSHMPKQIMIVILLALAVWKALLVALYYMHLKSEPRKLHWIVMAPLPLIVILIGIVLLEAW